MPDKVASRFAADGTAIGQSSKTQFLLLTVGLNIGVTIFTAVLAALLPKLPNTLINVPHKDYWLHPDRRAETLADMRLTMLIIAGLTSVFLAAVFHLVCRANIQGRPLLSSAMGTFLALFLGAIAVLVIRTLIKYRRPAT
ncbi:MAG: hypothetical protein Aurels2KO_49020 [Aureliella sp.]